MSLLPKERPYWAVAVCWNTYPFRIVWLGFWSLAYDRSGGFYTRWPHCSLVWNDEG